jgi:hypothetical protein
VAGASRVSRCWHAAIAVVVVASLVIQLALLFAGGADANSGETGGGVGVATIGFHYVVPWATIIGWLVFGPRPRIDWETVLAAVLAVVFKLLDDRLPRTTASPVGDTASIQGHP